MSRPRDLSSFDRTLLTTVTGEPLQPVRLYWRIPSKAAVRPVFAKLRCIVADRLARTRHWLYQAEATRLTFSKPYDEVPSEMHPIHIGCFRMPRKDQLVLEVRSYNRAVEAARFFSPLFGPKVVLARARLLNGWLAADEAARGLDGLDRLLDANVVVIDPRRSEEAFERAMAGTRTHAEKLRALEQYSMERRKTDVPRVEDFPLAPAEETPDFVHLATTLSFRTVRAHEHWKGNTHLTLADIIRRTVEDGIRRGAFEGFDLLR